jgi:hypothetical protein
LITTIWKKKMNEHIELVKKWLADPESVTKQAMEANANAATATLAADAAAAYAAAAAAYAAAAYAAAADAAYWVKRYDEFKEQGE